MFKLKEWCLDVSTYGFKGHGKCFNNPNFFSGEPISTSPIMRIEVDEEESQLKLFTKSGSCYVLKYEDIDDLQTECTQKVLDSMDVAVNLQKCVALKEKRIKVTKQKVSELLNPSELYVVMTGGQGITEAYFKKEDGVVVPIPIGVHLGMFQDSIIVADRRNGLCDWRIFPSDSRVQPYHWSDYLAAVYIENVGEDFIFVGSARDIECKSGVVTVIKSEEYVGEGLFSPDVVNGKSLISTGFLDKTNDGR